MNNAEAKFNLAAYRPDGRDAHDVRFAEAIALTERDPELRAWWQRQRAFDSAVAAKLATVQPPPDLRAAILAGGRASRPRRRGWNWPVWLAAAAAVAVLAIAAVTLRPFRGTPSLHDLASSAVQELVEAHDGHAAGVPALAGLEEQLAARPLAQTLHLDLADLGRTNCRTVKIAGREMFEFCFQRDGSWFHLFVARRADFAAPATGRENPLVTLSGYAGTAWADAANVYALVTGAGAAALQRVM